jgi:hypothetical protein
LDKKQRGREIMTGRSIKIRRGLRKGEGREGREESYNEMEGRVSQKGGGRGDEE